MATNIFQKIFAEVDEALATYIVETVGRVIAFAGPAFTSMMILYIAIWGYMMMFGKAQEPLRDGVFRIIKIGAILALGLTLGTYLGVVVPFLRDALIYLATVVTGGAGSIGASLDQLFERIYDVSLAAWQKGGVMNGNFGLYLIALILLVVGGGLTLYIAFLVLLATFMTTILLGIGPIFIIGLLFSTTQRFFEAWLGMLANFGVLLILSASVGALLVSMASSFVMNMGPAASLSNLYDTALLCLVFAMCILVVRQLPSVAAALGGGIALATQGAFGAAMNAMRPSTMRRGMRSLNRDVRATSRAVGAPARAGMAAARAGYAAYQKRFKSNSVSGAA